MSRPTPSSAQEWYDATRARIAATGYRAAPWTDWPTWPFDGDLVQRELEPPGAERPRGGAGGVDCFICEAAAGDGGDYVVWRDDVAMLGQPRDDVALPFVAFLMPRRHADLSDLAPDEAARMGGLMVLLERAVTDVLDVPRAAAHPLGRRPGAPALVGAGAALGRGPAPGAFTPLWDDLLPPRPRAESRRDLEAVARRLVELAGGELPWAAGGAD